MEKGDNDYLPFQNTDKSINEDALENLISRETEGRARCQNFPTH